MISEAKTGLNPLIFGLLKNAAPKWRKRIMRLACVHPNAILKFEMWNYLEQKDHQQNYGFRKLNVS